jgi:DNA-binding Lrp family transcriptional regulator
VPYFPGAVDQAWITLENQVENERLLDNTGWRILEELQGNARLTHKELGRRVNLSAPAAAERVRRMEEAWIITGYRAQIDPETVGLPLTAFVRIEVPGANHKKGEALVVRHAVCFCHARKNRSHPRASRDTLASRKALFRPSRLSVITAASPSGSQRESGTSCERISSV